MRKLIALTPALLLLPGCSSSGGHARTEWVLAEERTTYYDTEAGTARTSREVYDYGRSGNMTRDTGWTDTTVNPDGTRTVAVCAYSETGSTITTNEYQDDTLVSTSIARYDLEGRTLEDVTYDARGNILNSQSCTYEGNTVTIRYEDGYVLVKSLRPDGQTEMEEWYDPAGNLVSRTEYSYREISIR